MHHVIDAIRSEFARYKALAEGAIRQVSDAEVSIAGPNNGSSIATICWHISGNLHSRFTDFLTSDGEKPWRRREGEFEPRAVTKAELLTKWEKGWSTLQQALAELRDDQLSQHITIRGQALSIVEALQRSLAHTAYHVGQIVYLAKSARGQEWKSLSIPPGGSEAYNTHATFERAGGHTKRLEESR
jgi:uncharacterized damage-inducible protein DinB